MVIHDFGAVLLFAIAVTAVFDRFYAPPGQRRKLWTFFAGTLLASWLIGALTPPYGPSAWGISWLRFLVPAVLAAAALGLRRRGR